MHNQQGSPCPPFPVAAIPRVLVPAVVLPFAHPAATRAWSRTTSATCGACSSTATATGERGLGGAPSRQAVPRRLSRETSAPLPASLACPRARPARQVRRRVRRQQHVGLRRVRVGQGGQRVPWAGKRGGGSPRGSPPREARQVAGSGPGPGREGRARPAARAAGPAPAPGNCGARPPGHAWRGGNGLAWALSTAAQLHSRAFSRGNRGVPLGPPPSGPANHLHHHPHHTHPRCSGAAA